MFDPDEYELHEAQKHACAAMWAFDEAWREKLPPAPGAKGEEK